VDRRAELGRDRGGLGPVRARSRRRPGPMPAKATILCYGMGLTQHRQLVRHRAAAGQPAAAEAAISAGRGRGSARCGAIPTSRATARSASGRSRRALPGLDRQGCSASSRRASTATRWSRRSRPWRRARPRCSSAWAATSPSPRRSDPHLRGDAQAGLAVHIATKPNRTHLLVAPRSLLLPCLGRTEIDLQAGGASR
jgi:hypothetical protein